MTRERKARKIPPYNELNAEMRDQMAQFDRNRGLRDITLTSTSTLQLERKPVRSGVPRPNPFQVPSRPSSRHDSASNSGTLFWVVIAAVAGFIGHDYLTRKRPPLTAPRLQSVSPAELRQVTPPKGR
jgi:hypothetical protein